MTQLRLALEAGRASGTATLGGDSESHWSSVILIEDNAARSQRRVPTGIASRRSCPKVAVRVHRIQGAEVTVIAEKSYRAGELSPGAVQGGRSAIALELLDRLRHRRKGTVVVAGPTYGSNRMFLSGLLTRR